MRRLRVLRDTDFRRFFVGQLVSLLGDQASVLAIPLTAVLVLDAGPMQLGLLTAAGILPSLFFSLAAGGRIDRRGRRREAMLVADAVRAVAVLSLPIAYVVGHLTLVHLYVVAFVVGTFDVTLPLPTRRSLSRWSTGVTTSRRTASSTASGRWRRSSVWPSVEPWSGSSPHPWRCCSTPSALSSAVPSSFVVSGAQLARIHPVESPGDTSKSRSVAGGIHWIRGNPAVWSLLLSSAAMNLFAFIGNTLLVLYASRTLGVSPAVIGLVFGAGAVGGVIGAATCGPVSRRLGLGRMVLLASFAFCGALLRVRPAVLNLRLEAEAEAEAEPEVEAARVGG